MEKIYKGKARNKEVTTDYSEAIICWLTIIGYIGLLAMFFLK